MNRDFSVAPVVIKCFSNEDYMLTGAIKGKKLHIALFDIRIL